MYPILTLHWPGLADGEEILTVKEPEQDEETQQEELPITYEEK